MTPANYPSWRSKKLWTIYELAFLLKGLEPRQREDAHQSWQKVDPEMDEMERFYGYLCSIAARDPELRCRSSQAAEKFKAPTSAIDSGTLLLWVDGVENVTIPQELRALLESAQSKQVEIKARDEARTVDKPSSTRERQNLLLIIAVMAKELDLDLSRHYKAARILKPMMELAGVDLSENTLAKKLEAAFDHLKDETS